MKELNSSVESKKLEHSEFKMAAMMVCTVMVFVVCNSFHTIYFIMYSQEIVKGETANTLWRMSHILMTFNCSAQRLRRVKLIIWRFYFSKLPWVISECPAHFVEFYTAQGWLWRCLNAGTLGLFWQF